jgi:tetratricopeptide (TPR) repeat protein
MAWFLAATATLAPIFPLWVPSRSVFGALGIGVVAVATLGPVHSRLLGALVALRLVAFALSPPPAAVITVTAPETGAFFDFERLTRLQRLVRETRSALVAAHPTLPAHAVVGLYNLPYSAEYSYGGSRSLQVWYRDSTLHWVRFSDMLKRPDTAMAVVVEFEQHHRPQIVLVPPEAMRALIEGLDENLRMDWRRALRALDRADSLVRDTNAVLFRAQVAGSRSVALSAMGFLAEAEREARLGIALWPLNVYALYGLALVEYRRGRLTEAATLVDEILRINPDHRGARLLANVIRDARYGAADSTSGRPR